MAAPKPAPTIVVVAAEKSVADADRVNISDVVEGVEEELLVEVEMEEAVAAAPEVRMLKGVSTPSPV